MSLNTGNAILSNAITVDGSYNVGIGTTTPLGKLHVSSPTAVSAYIVSSGGDYDTNLYLGYGSVNTETYIKRIVGNLSLGTSAIDRLYISSGGNVGIGTSSPSTLLHLNATTTQLTLQNTDGGTNAERIGMFMTGGDTFKLISLNDNNTTRVDNILVANVLTGNVGIGTSSPSYVLDVQYGGNLSQRIRNNAAGGTATLLLETANTFSGTSQAYVQCIGSSGGGQSQLVFATAGASGDTTATERMRITSAGIVCINTTSGLPGSNKLSVYNTDAGPTFANATTTQQSLLLWNQGTTGNNLWTEFHTESSITFRGSIYYNRAVGLVVYGTSSDYRIKTEIEEFNALDIIKKLKPKKFKINDAEQKSYGFIAHELQEFVPQAVVGQKDEIKEDGTPKLQQVDYAQLTGLLTKAIQEQQTMIEKQQEQINQLINK